MKDNHIAVSPADIQLVQPVRRVKKVIDFAPTVQRANAVTIRRKRVWGLGCNKVGLRCVGFLLRKASADKAAVDLSPETVVRFEEYWRQYLDCPLKGRNGILKGICPQVSRKAKQQVEVLPIQKC